MCSMVDYTPPRPIPTLKPTLKASKLGSYPAQSSAIHSKQKARTGPELSDLAVSEVHHLKKNKQTQGGGLVSGLVDDH